MESARSATKKSFFREYFFYKLRGMFGVVIASAVISLIGCVLSGLFVLLAVNELASTNNLSTVSTFGVLTEYAGFLGMTGIAAITPIISFKYYRSRSSMDTIGCLPLTYGQRFWGDFLGGLAAIVVPFSVMSVIGGIFFAIVQSLTGKTSDEINKYLATIFGTGNIILFGVKMYLFMMILIVSAYAVTSLVVSCCGRTGSMVLYSIIAPAILPAVISLFGTFTLDCATGILSDEYMPRILASVPPIGTMIPELQELVSGDGPESLEVQIFKTPASILAALCFIAVMIAAAYFVGKRRKPERVGNSFVVNVMYHALTLLMVFAVIGVYGVLNRIDGSDITKILIGAVIALLFYLILEFVQYRNFKMMWKSLIRYVCVAVVGFGFIIIAANTHGFGIAKILPKQSDIAEIRMTGYAFGGDYSNRSFKYRADDAISAILNENKRLIEKPDAIFTGNRLSSLDNDINFTYELKNGETVSRCYSVGDAELCKDVISKIKQQPAFEIDVLGVLNRTDFTGMTMELEPNNMENSGEFPSGTIKSARIPELVECLRYDLANNVTSKDEQRIGFLMAKFENQEDYFQNGEWQINSWNIYRTHTKTVEFLKNPDNFVDESQTPDVPGDNVKEYILYYSFDYISAEDTGAAEPMVDDVDVRFLSNSDSEYVKELLSYIEPGQHSNEWYGIRINVQDSDGRFINEDYHIPEEKEQAAVKAMINLLLEQYGTIQ